MIHQSICIKSSVSISASSYIIRQADPKWDDDYGNLVHLRCAEIDSNNRVLALSIGFYLAASPGGYHTVWVRAVPR